MTCEEAEELAVLVNEYTEIDAPVTLTCAADVRGELNETSIRADAEVRVMPHYEPGQWELTLHQCDVTGGRIIDEAVIVTHGSCEVIAQNRGA